MLACLILEGCFGIVRFDSAHIVPTIFGSAMCTIKTQTGRVCHDPLMGEKTL